MRQQHINRFLWVAAFLICFNILENRLPEFQQGSDNFLYGAVDELIILDCFVLMGIIRVFRLFSLFAIGAKPGCVKTLGYNVKFTRYIGKRAERLKKFNVAVLGISFAAKENQRLREGFRHAFCYLQLYRV
jgi:hypothetical protein